MQPSCFWLACFRCHNLATSTSANYGLAAKLFLAYLEQVLHPICFYLITAMQPSCFGLLIAGGTALAASTRLWPCSRGAFGILITGVKA
jgi:hypothetical protein